ncbi:MAG: GPR endopeptidase [Clostridia bacterium]|nr:GPR endopeptidase [Clostridia bacterium]
MRQIRTDLAMESAGALGGRDLPGVQISEWETGGVTLTEVKIETEEGARLLGKPTCLYVTLGCRGVKRRDTEARRAVSALLGEELARLLPPEDGAPVLVAGLGNRTVTPDSLGPLTVDRTLVTRHLYAERPELTSKGMTPVCAVAPGVLGVTGVETSEMLRAIAQAVKPRAVVAVDSLAARAVSRVAGTVQLTDTGIRPGSGVGNRRAALTAETLGAPVLAVGVPMVIDATTIARDAFEMLSGDGGGPEREKALEAMTQELLAGALGEMIVTPREVDDLVSDAAAMLAGGINRALHPGLSEQDILTMMQ